MTLEEFHAQNPDVNEKLDDALRQVFEEIGGIEGLKKIQWFCSNADRYIEAASDCMHMNCPTCKGTGRGLNGPCVHMISCPCSRCSPCW